MRRGDLSAQKERVARKNGVSDLGLQCSVKKREREREMQARCNPTLIPM